MNLVVLGGESEEVDPKWDQLESHIISKGSKEGKTIMSGDLLVNLEVGTATLGESLSRKMRAGRGVGNIGSELRLPIDAMLQCISTGPYLRLPLLKIAMENVSSHNNCYSSSLCLKHIF